MAESASKSDLHLVVVGAGPGGYSAAFLAADLGLRVTLITDEPAAGGVCLHRGCIPSKALLHVARLIRETRASREWGLAFQPPEVDLAALLAWKGATIDKMARGLSTLLKKRGIEVITGRASFLDASTLAVGENNRLTFDRCILATGSRPVMPALFKGLGPALWDSTSALDLKFIPRRLLVVGGGYIGLEMGTVYSALGSEVSVVEKTASLLGGVDADLVRPLAARIRTEFAAVHLETEVTHAEPADGSLAVRLKGPEGERDERYDRVLVAVGRKPNSEALGLEALGIGLTGLGFIETGPAGQTACEGVYAIGDVAGGAMLAHKAAHKGRAAVEHILGKAGSGGSPVMPAVVFTDPEIAWCGLSEGDALEEGRAVTVARFPWAASGRAQTLGLGEGVSKWVVDKDSGRILGAGVVGTGAGELIAEAVLAIESGRTIGDIAHTVHAHPTLSETLMEAAQSYFGTAPHIHKPRR